MKRVMVSGCVFAFVVVAAAVASGAPDNGIPQRLDRIEQALRDVVAALTAPEPEPPLQTTRLLFPFVTNQAGFDTGISVANTGQDSSGTVGQAGVCAIHYFGTLQNGNPPARLVETTNRPVAVGETITFVLSTGGSAGSQGNANFQGYIDVACDFPLAHGFGFMTDGPIGQARVASTVPALVLSPTRTSSRAESLGQ